jgi:arabinan endo-1,5-alpha-L-arabinosidase
MKKIVFVLIVILISILPTRMNAQFGPEKPQEVKLYDMHWRDVCIFPDSASGYYYMIGPGGKSVLSYRSKDLIHWKDPRTIFEIPGNFWGKIDIVNIWAPELHYHEGKYYLFLTFNTDNKFDEQWPNWRPRVTRGSQILVSDSLTGPFKSFQNHSTLPVDMMTLDATLWVEDGKPYIVYAHEWVQISNGTMEYMQLKGDLSETIGDPVLMFRGNAAPWVLASKTEGCFVTDGPYLWKNKSGRLMIIWASYGEGGYTEGVAFSESGKLAGTWIQQSDPLYSDDGGHGMLFETFEGKLMMVRHSPNNRNSRPHIFEMEDTGDALKIKREL